MPGDPSRSGAAPVIVPGIIRLLLELAVFGFAVWCLVQMDMPRWAWMLGGGVILHYLISYDRIVWLMQQ